ncbi:DUF615 domain-containing protein [Catenovulum sp. SM1970]|uniref:ribosome biogenesis factor YjgA n=1 Tax=Marinifaba aquimaris TaxID=2741323 RepID=UPI0015736710|nr:ribosome biogenesis factor YjgA [Marinifaba aquimaris]NTS75883.1 DUF615 domain-containing protein [Marinifaba aquimaris]
MAKDWYDIENAEEIIYVSKSELKRDMDELKDLGAELIDMPAKKRAKITLDDETLEAIALGIKIRNKREAFRRHLQFVGRLLRNKDVEQIRKDMLRIQESHLLAAQHSTNLEKLRDELISEGDSAIQTLLQQHEDLDRSRLRQLVRQANKEKAKDPEKPSKSAQQLFSYLKEAIPFEL